MTFTISPEIEKFIDEQVKAGLFRSPQEVVEAGIARLMLDPDPYELDEQDLRSLEKSQAEIDRGELIDAEVVHAQIRKRFNLQR